MINLQKRLAGKVALIIGAAGKDNMGQGIARRLVSEGAKVVAAGRKEGPLKDLARELDGAYVLCDITDKQQVESMVDFVLDRYGKLDISVNCTGWGLMENFLDTTPETLDQMIAIHFKGPYYFMQACVRAMESGGSIIQITSAVATIMLENHTSYMGCKAGLDHVMRCVANEFGHKGIRANSIAPGLTETPMTAHATVSPSLVDTFRRNYPLGRIGTVEDIAAACAFLASDECFMTGQVVQINGGLTLRRNPTAAEIAEAMARDGITA